MEHNVEQLQERTSRLFSNLTSNMSADMIETIKSSPMIPEEYADPKVNLCYHMAHQVYWSGRGVGKIDLAEVTSYIEARPRA